MYLQVALNRAFCNLSIFSVVNVRSCLSVRYSRKLFHLFCVCSDYFDRV